MDRNGINMKEIKLHQTIWYASQKAIVVKVEKNGGNYGGDAYELKMPDNGIIRTSGLDPRLHTKTSEEVNENVKNLNYALWG